MQLMSGSEETLEIAMPADTARLRFREVRADDHAHIKAIYSDQLALRFLPQMATPEGIQAFIDRQLRRYERFGYGIWLLQSKDNGHIIGDAGLTWQETDLGDVLEIGYGLTPSARGRGLATEAAQACMAFGFEVLGAARLASLVESENISSRKVAERLHNRHRSFTHPRLGAGYLMFYTDREV